MYACLSQDTDSSKKGGAKQNMCTAFDPQTEAVRLLGGFACVRAAVAAVLLACACPGPLHAQVVAIVQETSGEVRVQRAGKGAWEPVTARGTALRARDAIKTGAAARAALLGTDSTKTRVNSKTQVSVERGAKGESRLRVMLGQVLHWVLGKRPTEVGTPAAVAATEGTLFEVSVGEDGTSTVTVVDGTVRFYNESGEVRVGASQQSTAVPGQAPTRPIVVDLSGIVAWESTVEQMVVDHELPLTNLSGAELDRRSQEALQKVSVEPGNAELRLTAGDLLHDQGHLEEALQQYQSAISVQPSLASAFARISLASYELGRLMEARQVCEQALQLQPQEPVARAVAALLDLSEGRRQRPGEALLSLAKAYPDDVFLSVCAGAVLLEVGRVRDAVAALESAAAKAPDSAHARAYLSMALLAGGNVKAAVVEAERGKALSPAAALVNESLGTALLYSGRLAQGEQALRTALSSAPEAAGAHLSLAKVLAAQGKMELAVREAELAVAAKPGSPAARHTLGVLYLATRDLRRAEREFREALKLAPDMAAAHTGLGEVMMKRGAFAEALNQQKASIAMDAGSAAAHNDLGALCIAEGKLKEALEELRRAIELQPNWGMPHANLAMAYLDLNRFREAVKEAEKAVALGDRSAVLRTTLAKVYLKQQRLDRAFVELRQAQSLDDSYAQAHLALGQIYSMRGRDRDALSEILRGASTDPGAIAESRQYARTEITGQGGTQDSLDGRLTTDGRGESGEASYYLSLGHSQEDGFRGPNSDKENWFSLGMAGYQAEPETQWLVYASDLRDRNGVPGPTDALRLGDPDDRRSDDGQEVHALWRQKLGERSHLTVKVGKRSVEVRDSNPDSLQPDPFSALDQNPFRKKRVSSDEAVAEARWDCRPSSTTAWRAIAALRRSDLGLNGSLGVVDISAPLPVFTWAPVDDQSKVTTRSLFLEQDRELSDRFSLTLGGHFANGTDSGRIGLPKIVGKYAGRQGERLTFVAQPLFRASAADLRPVEPWAQTRDFDITDLTADGSAMSYEVHYERPGSSARLLRLSAFMHRVHGLLVEVEDPALAPMPERALIPRAVVSGLEASYEQWLTPAMTLTLSGRWQRSSDERNGDTRIVQYPEKSALARLDYLDRAGWRLKLALEAVGPRYGDRGNTQLLPGYGLVSARVARQLDLHRELFIEASNLLDKQYQIYRGYPERGRVVQAGFGYRF